MNCKEEDLHASAVINLSLLIYICVGLCFVAKFLHFLMHYDKNAFFKIYGIYTEIDIIVKYYYFVEILFYKICIFKIKRCA